MTGTHISCPDSAVNKAIHCCFISLFVEYHHIGVTKQDFFMTTITLKSQPWAKYNLTKPMDGTEEKASLENYLTQAKSYLQTYWKEKNPGVENLVYENNPPDWTHVLTPWVLEGSDPAELLLRPGITQAEFYDTMLKRCKPQSAIVDGQFRDFIVQTCTPQSIDKQYRDIYNFASNFYESELHQKLDDLNTLALTLPILVDPTGPLMTAKTNPAPIVARIREELQAAKVKIQQTNKVTFVQRFSSLYLQGMLSADPSLFQLFEPNQVPMESTPPQIVEMIHTKILKPKNSLIALRPHGTIASPLTQKPAKLPVKTTTREEPHSYRREVEREERADRDYSRGRKPDRKVDKSIDLREPRGERESSRDRSRDSYNKSTKTKPSSHSAERETKRVKFEDERKPSKTVDERDWCEFCKKHAPSGNDRYKNHKIKHCYFDPKSKAFRSKKF